MGVRERLAGALDRRDEAPNVALAEEIAASGDTEQLAELADLVRSGTPRERTDAMKVFYEIGRRRPDLIAPECPVFLEALRAGSKRELWGAMQALDTVAEHRADELAAELPAIIAAADRGSVIAKDRCTSILVKLARAGYADRVVPILLDRLSQAAPNQFPSYAESTADVVRPAEKPTLLAVLRERLAEITQRARRERIERVIRKLNG